MLHSGEKIKSLREQAGYTIEELAGKVGVSPAYLRAVEAGRKTPSPRLANRIAHVLAVSSDFLAGESNSDIAVGEKVRLVRQEKKLSLEEMATKTGLSISYLSEIERGVARPSLSAIRKIAAALDVSPAVFLGTVNSIGMRLRSLREEKGLSQAQLAARAGVTAGMIGQIEQGKVQPSLKTLENIAAALGVTPCYFIIEPENVQHLMGLLGPEVRELLLQPGVQAVLRELATLNEQEVKFVLDFIQLYKRSGRSQK